MVLGFVLIIICGVYIATHARDMFGTMLAAGLTFLIGLQAFINVGVVTSALPNKNRRCQPLVTAARICSRCWRVLVCCSVWRGRRGRRN